MNADPVSATPPSTPEQRAENAHRYLGVLHRMIGMGADLAERIQQNPVNPSEAVAAGLQPAEAPVEAVSREFDRTVRGVRRSIILADRIQDPAPKRAEADPAQPRSRARRQILRAVEDEIAGKFDGEEAEAKHQELLDRLDSPELEDELGSRPTEELIKEISRDLDIAGLPGFNHPWKRRTPEDVAELHARAAQPASGARPAKPRSPAGPRLVRPTLPDDPCEAVTMVLRGEGRLPAE